jgi:hypothetical protein
VRQSEVTIDKQLLITFILLVGWRLSLYEIQILLVDLLSNFEFKLAEGEKPIERVPGMAMMPGLKGDRAAGRLLPLGVSILRH